MGADYCIRWSVDIVCETMHTLRRETSSCSSLMAVRTAFSQHGRTSTICQPGKYTDGSLEWPAVTMMPLPPFALPCVAEPSVKIVASKLSKSFSKVCMATAWSDASSPVFRPGSSKV